MTRFLELSDVQTAAGHAPFSLAMDCGDNVELRGASGRGKTSLLRVIAGLDRPVGGRIERGYTLCGFAFQEPRLLPHLTARENLMILPQSKAPGFSDKLHRVLCDLGISEVQSRETALLSGGERQRVNIARAVLAEPDCLVLDEAASNLDQEAFQKVADCILGQYRGRRMAIIQVSHVPDRLFGSARPVPVA
ncbi:MAG: ATP-binding cassette domain-containing protein [Pseudomonadota bacterium]